MPEYSAERALLIFLLLNAAIFGSAFFFSRQRLNTYGSQAGLNTLLLGYVTQYVAVGIPGVIGSLNLPAISITALFLSAILLIFCKPAARHATGPGRSEKLALWGISAFVAAFLLIYIHAQAYLPVMSNDALTYHFPAAAQWLQHGRIDLFQTWFFNPANTYSPLAGSIFIVWLMAPFHSVVLARFVEVPPLLGIGLAIYRIARQLSPGQSRIIAALLAAAAVLARPIFLPAMMGKDDLFVAFFFLVAVESLGREPGGDTRLRPVSSASDEQGVLTLDQTSAGRRPVSQGMIDALRAGAAIGLLLATKYTAMFCVPVLLLVIGNRWSFRQWMACAACILTLAGPWYLRNWIITANPIFPLAIGRLLPGLFTTARSDALAGWRAIYTVVDTQYGLPSSIAVALGTGWMLNWILNPKRVWVLPLRRICVLGPVIGIGLFFWRSPFPEVRFLLPFFLMLMVSLASVIPRGIAGMIIAAVLPVGALLTLGNWHAASVLIWFIAFSLIASVTVMSLIWWMDNRRQRAALIGTTLILCFVGYAYINWNSYSRDFADETAYALEYPPGLCHLWQFVNRNVPADATVAYTNLYLIFPMQQGAPDRRFVYAPTRPGVRTMADIGWLGDHLSGERIVRSAAAATVVDANRQTWLSNLRASGARFLVIGNSQAVSPEKQFVRGSGLFEQLFSEDGQEVWKINPKE